jgi:hypothetical protein
MWGFNPVRHSGNDTQHLFIVSCLIMLWTQCLSANVCPGILVDAASCPIELESYSGFFFCGVRAPSGPGPPHNRGFITLRHATIGRTSLDEWSARHKDLYLTTHSTHKRDIHPHCGIRTRNPKKRAATGPRLRPRGHRNGPLKNYGTKLLTSRTGYIFRIFFRVYLSLDYCLLWLAFYAASWWS